MKHKKYDPMSVTIEQKEELRASWRWNGRTISGTELTFEICDGNFDRLNQWTFSVKVPSRQGQIVVQPQVVPGKKVFAGLARRSVTFQRATKHPYRKYLYCKLNLADPTMEKNRRSTKRGDRNQLPAWFKHFRSRMKLKKTVTTTAGHDGDAQIVLVARDDYDRMIRLFFAMRVWVLQESVHLD